ncbi:7758_t:CDS:2 [Acaulospora colombiana]|uniref:7758_t:CDS:1 n=1 Tax=Acaulospora colombiana TaxID=27376 RepID=A0ACA9MKK5_9GLOM|nr:7758_t:CDS:2 [Acaulospora colombiana]
MNTMHIDPPQSTSVSRPSLIPSTQLLDTQTCGDTNILQALLIQSLAPRQNLPNPHGRHIGPPQSTSVSRPFLIPSAQLFEHTPLEQVLPVAHTFPQPPQLLGSFKVFISHPLEGLLSQLAYPG